MLCWTEKESGTYILKYAVYDVEKEGFGRPVSIPPSAGTRTSPESMNKVAFKADGTVVAVFGKRFEDEKNPFAGGILYSMSEDEGKSWSEPRYLHSDTSRHYGSFFDLAALPGGEIGAVWLDSRYGKADTGSALFFSRTEKNQGFTGERLVHKNTCECCRTDLLCDQAGVLHLAWRSILYPPDRPGKQVRDMLYAYSMDTGKTFSPPRRLSKDNWEIEGCPHTGPSLAVNKQGVHAVWFTAGGRPGIYHTHSPAPGKAFQERTLLSQSGRHPQQVTLPGGTRALALEESHAPAQPEKPHTHSHDHATFSAATSIILKNTGPRGDISITDRRHPAHHPVLLPLENGLLLAWVREGPRGSEICWTYIANV